MALENFPPTSEVPAKPELSEFELKALVAGI